MSSDRAKLTGVVVLTTCLTSVVLVGGWLVVTRYLGQQTVSAAREDVIPPTPPRKKPARAQRGQAVAATPPDHATSSDPAESAHDDTTSAAAASQKDAEPSSPPDEATTPAAVKAEPDVPSARVMSEAPAAAPEPGRPAAAVDARADARSVMEEVQRRSEATFYRYDGVLQSFDGKGRTTEKRWTFDREGSHGQSKAVLRFTAPSEVKGVALLIVNHAERASDQWMWTPAIERDRRIALQDRSTRVFGTDFSFEDLEERDVDQYDYSMLGTDTIGGAVCWKIQLTPKSTKSTQYTRAIAWIRQDYYVYARVDSFVKDEVVRRQISSSLENIQGIWTARQLDMADVRHGTHTILTLDQVKYNVPMRDDDFTLQAIRR